MQRPVGGAWISLAEYAAAAAARPQADQQISASRER
jgi:hypothetical protein